MSRVQQRFTLALLFSALLLLAYYGITLIGGMIGFLYDSVPGFNTFNNIARIAAILAAIGLFITAVIVAIPTALRPAGWGRKWLYVIPLYALGFLAFGALSSLIG